MEIKGFRPIFNRDGRISLVLVDVGGFLGIGKKTVALKPNQIRVDQGDILFNGTRSDLENMQEVDDYAFRRPYRGYAPGYDPYGGDGPYGYGPYYGPGYGAYHGPYAGDPMGGRYPEEQGGASQQDRRSYPQQGQRRGDYNDSRDGRSGMMQGRMAERGMMQGGMMRQGAMQEISGDLFLGAPVFNQWDKNIGELEDFVIDPASGGITHAVIEVGGFLGIGSKKVLIPFDRLTRVDPNYIVYPGSKRQLERMPEYHRGKGGQVTVLEQQDQKAGGPRGGQSQTQTGKGGFQQQ